MNRFLCAAFLCLLVSPAFATESRNSALTADYWRVSDDTNVRLFPSEIVNHKKVIFGELGTGFGTGDDYAGINVPVWIGTLGIYVGALPAPDSSNGLFTSMGQAMATYSAQPLFPADDITYGGLFTAGMPDGRLSALYGTTVGDRINLALGMDWYANKSTDDTRTDALPWPDSDTGSTTVYTDTDKSSQIGINLGISLPIGVVDPLAFGISIGLPSFEAISRMEETSSVYSGSQETHFNSTGGSVVDVNLRARLKEILGRGTASYVYFGMSIGSMEGESRLFSETATEYQDPVGQDERLETKTVKTFDWTAGISNNHRISESSLVIWSFGAEGTSGQMDVTRLRADNTDPLKAWIPRTTTIKKSTLSFPLAVALETKLTNWLTGRLSSTSRILNMTTVEGSISDAQVDDIDSGTAKTDASSQDFALGVTFSFLDKFDIDGTLKERFLFDGPYFIGGVGNGVLGQVSIKYTF